MFWSCKKNAPKFWKVKINVKLFFVVFTFCEAIINKLTLKAKGKNFKTFLTKQSWAKSKKVERCRDSKGAIQTYLSNFMVPKAQLEYFAEHFAYILLAKCTQNVQQNAMRCKNTFLYQMHLHFCTHGSFSAIVQRSQAFYERLWLCIL